MKSVKWLYALFFALTFTLCVEMTGAFAVKGGEAWCNTLTMPSFAIKANVHSILWFIVYVLEAVVISGLIVANQYKPFIAEYLTIKFLSALWTVSFFNFKLTYFCLVILTVILTFNFFFMRNMLKIHAHPLKNIVFLPVLCWYCYLWILNYAVVILN